MKYIKLIGIFILLVTITYIMFTISNWNINPKDWSYMTRDLFAFIGLPISGMLVIIYKNWNKM